MRIGRASDRLAWDRFSMIPPKAPTTASRFFSELDASEVGGITAPSTLHQCSAEVLRRNMVARTFQIILALTVV